MSETAVPGPDKEPTLPITFEMLSAAPALALTDEELEKQWNDYLAQEDVPMMQEADVDYRRGQLPFEVTWPESAFRRIIETHVDVLSRFRNDMDARFALIRPLAHSDANLDALDDIAWENVTHQAENAEEYKSINDSELSQWLPTFLYVRYLGRYQTLPGYSGKKSSD